MLPRDPIEVEHIGDALTAHRVRLGLDVLDMAAAAGGEHRREIEQMEKCRRLNVDQVQSYHRMLTLAYKQASEPRQVQSAVRDQWYVTAADDALWHAAKQRRPQCVWWWGARRDLEPRGAWCHVCNAPIHQYDVGRGLTKRGRLAVMTHRYAHVIVPLTLAPKTVTESYL
jgi:hypothetical protein